MFLLYAVILFLQSYEDFLTVNRLSTGKIPFQEIFRSGLHSTAAFVLLSGLLLLAVSQFAWLKPFLRLLRNGLAAILRFLFGLLPMDSGTEAVVVEQQAGGGDMPPMEAEDPFYFMGHSGICGHDRTSDRLRISAVPRNFKADHISQGQNAVFLPGTVSEQLESMDKREHLEAAPENTAAKQKQKWFSFAFLDAGQKIRRMYQKK